jgi:PleD family two-component response regulator
MFEDGWLKVIEGLTTVEEVVSKIPYPQIDSDCDESESESKPVSVSRPVSEPESKPVSKSANGDNNKVLLFDNDEEEISTIRSALEENGYDVVYSTNGEMIEKTKTENPGLIIINSSDDKMAHLKEIRHLSQFTYTPIICLADKDHKEQEQEGFRLGINDFIYRPLDVKKLLFSINRITKTY